jgi:hypothetical protein
LVNISDPVAQCIAPELIILRVVLGRSWTTSTMAGERQDPQIHFVSRHSGDVESSYVDDAAPGTHSTNSQSAELHHRGTRTSLVVLTNEQPGDEEKKTNTGSAEVV